MKITPIKSYYPVKFKSYNLKSENQILDKQVLVKRKIISQNQDINSFLDNISKKIFPDDNISYKTFANYLKSGYISLSSNAYADLNNPQSAVALKLNPLKSSFENCFYLEKYLQKGQGIGLNFSEFDNPVSEIKKINSFFCFRSPYLNRPSAGIALLDIYNKNILDFITLKDNSDYKNWCFDLSVIMDDKFLSLADNNSTITLSNGKKIPAREIYNTLLNSMLKKGEPGIIFSNDKNYLTDPCAACALKQGESFTLGQINLSKFINSSSFDYIKLKDASNILNKALKRIDNNSYISILGYQELLDKLNLKYASPEALQLTSQIIKTIKSAGAKVALSPAGTISRFLKTTPSIEPKKDVDYISQINTISTVQNLIEGQISTTIHLEKNADITDIDKIIRYAKQKNLKGITVFKS